MRNYVIGGVDWKQYWVRTVVCGDTGEELNRAVWPRDEAEDHLVAFFQSQRDLYGVPMMVIGRCGSHWPDQILEGFWLAGFMVELYDGPTLGRLLRMEREYREDVSYRAASLLAAVHLARHRTPEVQELETFLLQWSIYQTKQRTDTDRRFLSDYLAPPGLHSGPAIQKRETSTSGSLVGNIALTSRQQGSGLTHGLPLCPSLSGSSESLEAAGRRGKQAPPQSSGCGSSMDHS